MKKLVKDYGGTIRVSRETKKTLERLAKVRSTKGQKVTPDEIIQGLLIRVGAM